MKTIKELAEEIGVSKVAVQKKMERLNIKNKMVRDGNRLLIPEELEYTIKTSFNKYTTENKTESNEKQTDNMTETFIAILQKELEEKNKQIERLQNIINQEQQLRMVTEQKLLALEDKENENTNKETKQGFWSRLFGTKPVDSTAKDVTPETKEDNTGQEGKV